MRFGRMNSGSIPDNPAIAVYPSSPRTKLKGNWIDVGSSPTAAAIFRE